MSKTNDQPVVRGLGQMISDEALRGLAGARSFVRGEGYFQSGYVGNLAEYQNRLTASVQGTRKYGVKAFPDRTDPGLREFLAVEYHRRKRHDEAMALIWTEFTNSPALGSYQLLQEHAQRIKDWPAWREQALACTRVHIAKQKSSKAKPQYRWQRKTDRSVLVQIFLWENNADAAWDEAWQGGCANDLWLRVVEKRAKEHPEDALPIYQKQIESTLAAKNKRAYEEAVKYLRVIRYLMSRMEKTDEFGVYFASVRAAHKRNQTS